jgi:hypothetical protein
VTEKDEKHGSHQFSNIFLLEVIGSVILVIAAGAGILFAADSNWIILVEIRML